MHGRVEGAEGRCAVPGCGNLGEYKAPIQAANFDGPGLWRLMCLDHVREHNAKYNFFEGMSPEEITEAQSPFGGWDRSTRVFATGGADPPPSWSDFSDPLDAISARIRGQQREGSSRFTRDEHRALAVLGLGEDADKATVAKRYRMLLRRYHPDRNKGDRTHERRLNEVIESYQMLRKSSAFS